MSAARYDCEYSRNGPNLLVFLDAHRAWREVKITDQRTAADFADCMLDLVDVRYPQAESVRLVMDNRPQQARCMNLPGA